MMSAAARSPWRGSLATAVTSSCQPSRDIQHKAARIKDPLKENLKPWDYKNKGYTRYHAWVEGTHKRLNENSKIIVVDGNIGSGKSTMARDVAEQLDFYHMDEFNVDKILVNSYGNDLRDHYDKLPKNMHVPDDRMFYANPGKVNVPLRLFHIMFGRYEQWLNAVAHVLNTGQGVVLERSIFSDFVFVNALREKGLITPQFFRLYHWFRNVVLMETQFMPHLCIFIDRPVEQCFSHIKSRNVESTKHVVDERFMHTINESYNDMLKEFKSKSKVLIYDWDKNLVDGIDRVIEDIEAIDFDFYDRHSVTENRAWFAPSDDWNWSYIRYQFTDKTDKLKIGEHMLRSFDIPDFHSTRPQIMTRNAVLKKYMFKDGYAWGSHPSEFGKNWLNQLTNMTIWDADPANKWYEHYFKDQYFSNNIDKVPDEWSDWSGNKFEHAH